MWLVARINPTLTVTLAVTLPSSPCCQEKRLALAANISKVSFILAEVLILMLKVARVDDFFKSLSTIMPTYLNTPSPPAPPLLLRNTTAEKSILLAFLNLTI